MERRQQWIANLNLELSNSPLASNVFFGFILMGLEKLVEVEFECPCNPKWNKWFSSAFFIIPPIMAFILMLISQGFRRHWSLKKRCSSFVSSSLPAVVWLILLFFDGQYFACAVTYWQGTYVPFEKAALQKWCEPSSEKNDTRQERMLFSKRQYFISQGIGILFLIFICGGLVWYANKESKKTIEQDANVVELNIAQDGGR